MRRRTKLKFWIAFLLLVCILIDGGNARASGGRRRKPAGPLDLSEDVRTIYDPVHGVKMGIPLRQCDDGENGIEVDWDPRSEAEYSCYISDFLEINFQAPSKDLVDNSHDQPMHVCLDQPINYPTDLPLSGSHRPLWPVFGEYRYLPPQRWVHSLEHGAIVLLFHPCMQTSPELAALKSLVRDCLGKHVISPYRKIPFNMPFALLAFKHARLIGRFDPKTEHDVNYIIDFIKQYALEGPETHVLDNGQYTAGLIRNATDFSDLQENKSSLCAFLK